MITLMIDVHDPADFDRWFRMMRKYGGYRWSTESNDEGRTLTVTCVIGEYHISHPLSVSLRKITALMLSTYENNVLFKESPL